MASTAQFSFREAAIHTTIQDTQSRREPCTDRVPTSSGSVLGNGRYELGGVLGRGAMAEVRDGWDLRLGRPVAIKLLYPVGGARADGRLRFETEAHAAAQLTGPHVVVVHDVGEHEGLPFIVMERLPGVTLADHIARGPLSVPFVQCILDGILSALAEAHSIGILHRDVKPANILFTATGEPKLADFGIAKTSGGAYTKTGEIIGSMAYLSPDRLASKPANEADDLYAVGVVGYEALTGRRPFPQEELGALARAILNETPPPLAALRPDVPPNLAAAIERAMARDPKQRFAHADAMRAALAGADTRPNPFSSNGTRIMEVPLPPVQTYTPAAAELKSAGEPRRRLWAAAILAALVLAIILLVVDSSSSGPPTPVTTTTPMPPPTSAVVETTPLPSSSPVLPAPAPAPNHPGKKHKGGH